jgi:hypothetical protein
MFSGGRRKTVSLQHVLQFVTEASEEPVLDFADGQQLNKQYDHNDFQVDVPDSIGVSKIYLSMYV